MNDKWILFDLGNTLYDESISDYERVNKLINNNNLSVSIDDFIQQMKEESKSYAESPFTSAREHFGIRANHPSSTLERLKCDNNLSLSFPPSKKATPLSFFNIRQQCRKPLTE